MEEKAKSKVLIYIIVVLVAIIVLLSIGGIYLYKELSKQENNNQLQSELNQEEKQVDKEIQIINDKEAKQNILVNGKIVEVKVTITDIEQSQEHTYTVSTKVEIDEKETEKVEVLSVLAQNKNEIKSNIYGNITTIRGENNKDYIIIVLNNDVANNYYILNENGKIIANFENIIFDGVKFEKDNIEEEYEDYIQIKDNYIIEYDNGRHTDYKGFDNGVVLKKWKITIKDNNLIRELLDTYTEDEIETKR